MEYEGFIQTNKQGELLISNKPQFDAFFLENKDTKFIFKAQKVTSNNSGKTSAYYFAEVLPKIIKGFQSIGEYHSKASVMQELKKYSTTLWKSELIEGEIKHVDVEFEDLNYFQKRAHISEVIKFGAEQLSVVIEEPK